MMLLNPAFLVGTSEADKKNRTKGARISPSLAPSRVNPGRRLGSKLRKSGQGVASTAPKRTRKAPLLGQ
jgi:hypothetical protein